MNIGQILLLTHLIGAGLIGALVVIAFISLAKNTSQLYKSLAVSISIGAGVQLLTGSLLALTLPGKESLLYFCSKVGVYLAIVLIAEFLLFKRMQSLFPAKIVASSVMLGMLFVISTISNL